ncbi:hypothetical protein [uncultured Jannaschia sp.]|uniref:hypothetical protein n=1 Tax=uncultured Jannaschia sp. TaxID=293347 RepID=UPI002610E5C5|nr:hypothetical protein [uncultured Jannaschia sp.]
MKHIVPAALLAATLLTGGPATALGIAMGDLTPRLDFPKPLVVPLSTKGSVRLAD